MNRNYYLHLVADAALGRLLFPRMVLLNSNVHVKLSSSLLMLLATPTCRHFYLPHVYY